MDKTACRSKLLYGIAKLVDCSAMVPNATHHTHQLQLPTVDAHCSRVLKRPQLGLLFDRSSWQTRLRSLTILRQTPTLFCCRSMVCRAVAYHHTHV